MTISAQANQNVQVAQTPKTQAPAPAAMKALQAQQTLATEAAAPKESVNLSPAARLSLAEHKAETSFAAGTKAFNNLNDCDRTELAGMIQDRLNQAGDKKLSDNQSNDIKAQVASEWLNHKADAGPLPAGYHALDQAAHDYQVAREDVKSLTGVNDPAIQAVSDVPAIPEASKAPKEKAEVAFNRFNGAFDKLPEAQKKELGAAIGAELKKLGFTKDTPEVVRAEQTWMTEASVSAQWAGEKAAAGWAKTGADAANLGDLYYGGMDYLRSRNEYLKAGGPIGQ